MTKLNKIEEEILHEVSGGADVSNASLKDNDNSDNDLTVSGRKNKCKRCGKEYIMPPDFQHFAKVRYKYSPWIYCESSQYELLKEEKKF